jgi:proteic killer suppression protein
MLLRMIRSFRGGAEDIFNGRSSRAARQSLPQSLWRVALRKLEALDSAEAIQDLRVPPGNRLEQLKGDRSGQYSIRINDQFRICFRWTDSGPEGVEIVDYH